MAVYTKVSKQDLRHFLNNYNLGNLVEYTEIAEGSENSNLVIVTSKGKYILTIFEKRVKEQDIPFFIELKLLLFESGLPVPLPIADCNDVYINRIKNKPAIIVSFVQGCSIYKDITSEHCYQLGTVLAQIHKRTIKYKLKRVNNLGIQYLQGYFEAIANYMAQDDRNIISVAIQAINQYEFRDLRTGIIHGDLFPDNVFFIGNKISGIIDFYFASNDFLAYDLAICINAWCFEKQTINHDKSKHLITGYNDTMQLTEKEIKSLQILCLASAIRFTLTRYHDCIKSDHHIYNKNPQEYLDKIKFFLNNEVDFNI